MCKWFQIPVEAIQYSKLVHKQGFLSLGWESYMVFESKHSIQCQADHRIWPKTDSLRATLAQITCVHDCRLLQEHFKIKIGSQSRIIKPGMGIIHGLLSQPQPFLPSWPPIFGQKRAVPELVEPRSHVRMVADCCRSIPKSKMVHKKVYKAWDGISIQFFHPNTPFSAKPTPKFDQKRTVWGLFWPKSHMCMIVDWFRSIPKSNLVHNHGL